MSGVFSEIKQPNQTDPSENSCLLPSKTAEPVGQIGCPLIFGHGITWFLLISILGISSFAGAIDDPSFIVLTETKFSFRCIPVWDRYSPHRTRVEKKSTCDNALTMTSPVHW
jgi:hypothetical protein